MFLNIEGLELVIDERRFLLHADNHIAFLYAYQGYANKPYIAVLRGPSGKKVLEDSPADHIHHHGVWWGHGDVNGVDFYLEAPAPGRRLGRIEHMTFESTTNQPPRYGFRSFRRRRRSPGRCPRGRRSWPSTTAPSATSCAAWSISAAT
jgi:hypothetical protein